MKHTLPALIEDLQAFQEKISEADFLVDLADAATPEQLEPLIQWVYKFRTPGALWSLEDGDLLIHFFVGKSDETMETVSIRHLLSPVSSDEVCTLELAETLEGLARQVRLELTDHPSGYECLSAISLEDIKNAKP